METTGVNALQQAATNKLEQNAHIYHTAFIQTRGAIIGFNIHSCTLSSMHASHLRNVKMVKYKTLLGKTTATQHAGFSTLSTAILNKRIKASKITNTKISKMH